MDTMMNINTTDFKVAYRFTPNDMMYSNIVKAQDHLVKLSFDVFKALAHFPSRLKASRAT